MAKKNPERIIDTPFTPASRSSAFAVGTTATTTITGGGAGGGSSTFTGLTDTPSTFAGQAGEFLRVNSGETAVEFVDIADSDLGGTTVVFGTRTITAGDGLDGGGNLSSDRTLSVDVTDFIDSLYGLTENSNNLRVNLATAGGLDFLSETVADRRTHTGDTRTTAAGDLRVSSTGTIVGNRGLKIKLPSPSGLDVDSTGLYVKDTIAGAGLSISSKILSVNVGDGLEIDSDTVKVDLASTSGLSFSSGDLQIDDSVAGAGLTVTSKVLAVGAGDGIDVAANSVAVDVTDIIGAGLDEDVSNNLVIGTPSTLHVASTNFVTGTTHFHAITSSADPGAAASLLATDGTGNLALDTDTLYVSADSDAVWVNSGTPDGSAAVKVTAAAINDYTLYLKQLGSQTADILRIEDSGGAALLLIQENGELESGATGFVSGLSGWQIKPDGDAEFNNITARGEFHASTFVMDEMMVTTGTDVLVKSGGRLLNAVTTLTTPTTRNRTTHAGDTRTTAAGDTRTAVSIAVEMDIEDPETGHAALFSDGDILRVKDWTGAAVYDNWLTVNSITDNTTYYTYFVSKNSGTATTLPAGAIVVDYGVSGDGGILATASLSGAPYDEIFSIDSTPWSGVTSHFRRGKITGVGTAVGTWGLIGGTDLSDTSLDAAQFEISDSGVYLRNTDLTIYDDSNNPRVNLTSGGVFKLGTDIDATATTGFSFDPTTNTVNIGSSSYTGTVNVYGVINVLAGSNGIGTFSDAGALATLDDITLSYVTDAGTLAGLSTLTLSYITDVGNLAALNDITLSLVTDAGALAAKNTLDYADAELTGLGVLATKNTLDYADAELTGLGALAALNNITTSYVTDAGALATADSVALGSAQVTGDLDDVSDGATYKRVKGTAITAAGLISMDAVVDGSYAKVSASALNAGGLVLLDQVVTGTYGLVSATNISAGQIILSQVSGDLDDIADGSGHAKVSSTIIASGLIQIGTGTKDTDLDGWHFNSSEIVGQSGGSDQVVLNTSGQILAGSNSVRLDENGLTLGEGETEVSEITWKNSAYSATVGRIWAFEDLGAVFNVDAGGTGIAKDGQLNLSAVTSSGTTGAAVSINSNGTIGMTATSITFGTTTPTVNGNAVWHAGNDGAGSGLDADLLDGVQLSAILQAANNLSEIVSASTARTNLGLTGNNNTTHYHDTQYYTQSQLDNGQLDSRYFTESELNGGQLNSIYYTKTNMQTSGQASVHWNNITNAPSYVTLADSWTSLTLESNWVAVSGYYTPGYMKQGNMIFLRGVVDETGGATAHVATLPAGYRPAAKVRVMQPDTGGISSTSNHLEIDTNGEMRLSTVPGSAYVILDGIYFSL